MRRLSPARLPIALMALCLGTRRAHADDSLRYDLRGELGGEFDSNAHRTEIVDGIPNPPIVGSPLARAALSGHLTDAVAADQQIALAATLAGKLFTAPAARDEDLVLAASSARWRLALGDATGLGAQATYYEAFQRPTTDPAAAPDRRDFRSLTPALMLDRHIADNTVIVAAAGYRSFVFKSDLDFDFHGPTGSIDLRWTRESTNADSDWELTAGGSLELRAFSGLAGKADGTLSTAARQDTFLVGHVELTRVGRLLLGGGYSLQWNDSNSYGDALTRHLFTLRLATALPFDCYLAARGELILAQYRDPVTLGAIETTGKLLSIDDENRNSLRVDVSRALSEHVQLLARYTLYANELGLSSSVARYRRQTFLVSLAFTLER